MSIERLLTTFLFLFGIGATITLQNWSTIVKMPIRQRITRLLVLNLPLLILLNLLYLFCSNKI